MECSGRCGCVPLCYRGLICNNNGVSSAYNYRSVTTVAYYWTTAGVRTISCRRKFVNVNNGRSNSTAFFRLKQRKQPLVSFLTGKNPPKQIGSGGTFPNLVGTMNQIQQGLKTCCFWVQNGRSNSTAFFRLKQRKQPLVSFLTGKNSTKTHRSGGTFPKLVGTMIQIQ